MGSRGSQLINILSQNKPLQLMDIRPSGTVDKITLFIFGPSKFLLLKDMAYLTDPLQTQIPNSPFTPDEEDHIRSIQTAIGKYLLTGGVLSVGCNLAAQKLSPRWGEFNLGKLVFDLSLFSLFVCSALYLSLESENLLKPMKLIKRSMLERKNPDYIRFLSKQSIDYGISLEHQIRKFMTVDEYESWAMNQGRDDFMNKIV